MAKAPEYSIKEISVVEVTVAIDRLFWDVAEIQAMLEQIESTPGFMGFTKIILEVEELPRVTYYRNVSHDQDN